MKVFLKRVVVTILTLEARLLLWRTAPTIIAVTGSVGKTSTKDAIHAALAGTMTVRKSQKSFNSELGVPLTVLGLDTAWDSPLLWLWTMLQGAGIALFPGSYPEVLVLEAGVDTPGDMAKLTSWLAPDVVVLTRLPDVPVHVEHFPTPAAVVAEKMQLVTALKPDGVLVYNADDPVIVEQLKDVRQQTIGYARYAPAPVMIGRDRVQSGDAGVPTGMSCLVQAGEVSAELVQVSVLGTQSLYAVAAAVAVAKQFGVAVAVAVDRLSQLDTPPGRMRIIPGIKDSVLIDDTYNSSPIALEHALDSLARVEGGARRVAVLGDMLELGEYTAAEHERLGEKVARTCDALLTVGIRARGFAVGAQRAGMDEANIRQYETAERAGRELQTALQAGDIVLVKGSQGVRTEKIVKEVMAQPQQAAALLVRQDDAWQSIG